MTKDKIGKTSETVLVTGATGFIGKYVVRNLLASGYYVLATGRKEYNLTHSAFEYTRCDLSKNVFELKGKVFNHIVHIAASMPENTTQDDSSRSEIDIKIAKNLLSLISDNVKTFVFASSIDVYGIPNAMPVNEDFPLLPLTYYAKSKLEIEKMLSAHCNRVGVDLKILRVSQVFGPGEPVIKAIPIFISKAVKGKNIEIHGNGNDTRDYVYIDDVADAFILALKSSETGIFNIATGKGTTILEAAEKIIEFSGGKSKIVFADKVKKESEIIIDISKAKEKLGFIPKIGFCAGVARHIKTFEKKSIFLDFDGTLIDVSERYYSIYTDFLKRFDKDTLDKETYWNLKRRKAGIKEILSQTSAEDIGDEYAMQRIAFLEKPEYLEKDTLFDFTIPKLKELKSNNSLILVSLRRNKENAIEQLKNLGLYELFDKIVIGFQDVSDVWKIKADMISSSGFLTGESIVIGDTEADVKCAEMLGIYSFAVESGIRNRNMLDKLKSGMIIENLNRFQI